MRIRTIKPDFFTSEDIAALTPTARLLFIGLWCYVDDNGVGLESFAQFAAQLCLHDFARNPQATLRQVESDYRTLEAQGLIECFNVDGKPLFQITTWARHQVISRPSKGHNYPTIQRLMEDSLNTHGALMEDSVNTHGALHDGKEGKGREGKGKERIPPSFPPQGETKKATRGTRLPEDWYPTPELQQWALTEYPELNLERETERFRDYWLSATGTKATKRDWNRTFRNWIRNSRDRNTYQNQPQPKTQQWATAYQTMTAQEGADPWQSALNSQQQPSQPSLPSTDAPTPPTKTAKQKSTPGQQPSTHAPQQQTSNEP